MADYFDDDLDTEGARIGREIYRNALEDRRGFRPDQIGIPSDDDVWVEIFEALASAAAMRGEIDDRPEGEQTP